MTGEYAAFVDRLEAIAADLDEMAFNTAIARMMEFTNFFLKEDPRPRAAMEPLVLYFQARPETGP